MHSHPVNLQQKHRHLMFVSSTPCFATISMIKVEMCTCGQGEGEGGCMTTLVGLGHGHVPALNHWAEAPIWCISGQIGHATALPLALPPLESACAHTSRRGRSRPHTGRAGHFRPKCRVVNIVATCRGGLKAYLLLPLQ